MIACDIVLIGVGGQGIVTLGDLIGRAALAANVPVSYVPTKGMAQRGGFVKVEIRLGRETVGPRVPEHGADLVVSMERSEALKGLRFVRPNSRFILYDHVWEPTGVMLGKDDYPSQESVLETMSQALSDVLVLNPDNRPIFDDRPVAANVFTLGAMFSTPILRESIDPRTMESVLLHRWPKASEANLAAFHSGVQEGDATEYGFSQFSGGRKS
ncbi:2-oxoacid:acceptor oxidoreductase family protein [Candidatus Bipolaricaulota bacterium]|nr:2-oxoacid:acceptor oxidoreductase family protein [Candidatus Bipolaricaulota bacterium]